MAKKIKLAKQSLKASINKSKKIKKVKKAVPKKFRDKNRFKV